MAGRLLESIDYHHLTVLHTLLAERSVTRTAVQLNQTQPAISAALRRLRALFGDALLVRNGNAMVPTPRALALQPHLRTVLDEMERIFTLDDDFDPATARTVFRIGCPDYLATVYMAGVVDRLRRQAPFASLVVNSLGPDVRIESALADGDLDIVIGNWAEPPANLHIAPLLTDEIVCLMARDHPLAHGVMSREDYLNAPHVVPLSFSSTHRGVIDKYLSQLRVSRNTVVTVPFFSMAPYLLAGTDLIFTISRHFARHYASLLPLTVVPCPIAYPPMEFYQLWHSRTHGSKASLWLRGLLRDVARNLDNGNRT